MTSPELARRPRIWVGCVAINDHDKAYFDRQVTAFSRIAPVIVTWSDGRASPSGDAYVMPNAWDPLAKLRGGYRLARPFRALRRLVTGHAHGPSRGEQRDLEELSKTCPPDLIYAHTGFMALRLLPIKRKTGVPMIAHFHGLDVTTPDADYRREIAAGLSDIDQVIVVGTWMKDWFVARGYPKDRIHVIPLGAPRLASPPHRRSSDSEQFISVGRLVGCKGFAQTIAAFEIVARSLSSATLTIVGDGPLREDIAAAAGQSGVADRIELTGSLSAADTLRRIADADIYVQHALDKPGGPEAFGITVCEAMMLGKPVVGTRSGGLLDQIIDGKNGYLVDQHDVTGMSRHMLTLANDPELSERLGNAGRERALAEFEASKLAHAAEDLILGAISATT